MKTTRRTLASLAFIALTFLFGATSASATGKEQTWEKFHEICASTVFGEKNPNGNWILIQQVVPHYYACMVRAEKDGLTEPFLREIERAAYQRLVQAKIFVSAKVLELAEAPEEAARVAAEIEEQKKLLDERQNPTPAPAPPTTEYTVKAYYSQRSNFAVFGSTSGSHPVGIADISAERGNWGITFISVNGIGKQEYGELVDYIDIIPTHSNEFGELTFTFGSEFFRAPAQPGSPRTIFIAPLATLEWSPSDHFSLVVGGQYAATYKTSYKGDRSFVWLEPTFSVGQRFKLSLSPGVVWADTGRSTQYFNASVEWAVRGPVTLYTSYLRAKSWDMYGVEGGGIVRIEPTFSYGAKATF
jgi:hypothetical protein